MRNIVFILALLIILGVAYVSLRGPNEAPEIPGTETAEVAAITVVAEGLEIPWDIAFLPDESMLVTERPGRLLHIGKDGAKKEVDIPGDVLHRGEGGLLGITLHPEFERNNQLYLYFSEGGAGGQTKNSVERYVFGESLSARTVIITDIPGATYHDGGRMEFGPDGFLYITTGDATVGRLAEDRSSLAGKILRLKDDGSIPSDNPFGSAVYSYGHRNPQGLAWDSAGRLWETEHGPTGEQGFCCRDEINVIQAGGNYGWPESKGDTVREGTETPALHSGANSTWAPASAAMLGNSLFFGGLKGEALYEAVLDGERVIELKEHFNNEFGRIRTVRVGPDGMLYLTTSNRDGRGDVQDGDDKIIRVDPELLE